MWDVETEWAYGPVDSPVSPFRRREPGPVPGRGTGEAPQGALGHRDRRVPRRRPDAGPGLPGRLRRDGGLLQQHRHLRPDQPERRPGRLPDLPRLPERVQDPPGPPQEHPRDRGSAPGWCVIFICFSLIPTALLFVAATNITTTSIKSWIGARVGQALNGSLRDRPGEARRRRGVDAPAGGGGGEPPEAGDDRRGGRGGAAASSGPGRTTTSRCCSSGTGRRPPRTAPRWAASSEEILLRLKNPGTGKGDGGTFIGDRYAVAWVPAPGGGDGRGGEAAFPRGGRPDPEHQGRVRRVPPGPAPRRPDPGELRRDPHPHHAPHRLRRELDGDLPRPPDHRAGAAARGGDGPGRAGRARRVGRLPVRRRVRDAGRPPSTG